MGTSKFSQSFSLDPAVDLENLSATLNDGVLIVSAPKDMTRIEENVRKIPILQTKTSDTEADTKNLEAKLPDSDTTGDEDENVLDLDTTEKENAQATGDDSMELEEHNT